MSATELSQEESDRITKMADPLVDHLMKMQPSLALSVLTATIAIVLLAVRHKEGKTALDTLDEHFFPAVRMTVEEELKKRAAFQKTTAAPVMDESKPHHGRIEKWHREGWPGETDGLGYIIMGTLLDHPRIPVKHTNTSLVLKHDPVTGEIETANSRYRLVGPEQHTP